MPASTTQAVPHVVAAPRPDAQPASPARPGDEPLRDPFLPGLVIQYLEHERADRFLTVDDLQRIGLSAAELREAAREAFADAVPDLEISLQAVGAVVSISCGLNGEATLLLADDLWPRVHEMVGPDLLVVVPARDVLVAGPPEALDELLDVVARVWKRTDRLLTRNVFRRVDDTWSLFREADDELPAAGTIDRMLRATVLPYLKAIVSDDDDDGRPAIRLSAEASPILDPFVADLAVAYVVDEGHDLTFVTESDLASAGLSLDELRVVARENLAALADQGRVRMHVQRSHRVFLFDGNLEATLVLWDDLLDLAHEALGPDLLVAVPARDILAIGPPSAVEELQDVIDRVWPVGDHLLSRSVLRRFGDQWSVYRNG